MPDNLTFTRKKMRGTKKPNVPYTTFKGPTKNPFPEYKEAFGR